MASKLDRRHPFRFDPETYRQLYGPVAVSLCTKHRRALLTGQVPEIVVGVLLERAARFAVRIHAYCIMPEHVHFVASVCPEAGEFREFMRSFKSCSARLINKALRLELPNRFRWQRSYWDRSARRHEDIRHQIEYVLANPVRWGLCERAEEWPHSKVLEWPEG